MALEPLLRIHHHKGHQDRSLRGDDLNRIKDAFQIKTHGTVSGIVQKTTHLKAKNGEIRKDIQFIKNRIFELPTSDQRSKVDLTPFKVDLTPFRNVNVTSGGNPTRGGLSFYLPGESKRVATGNAGKPIKMQPWQYEVVEKAYKLYGKPEKRVPFTIQIGQSTNLDVNF